MRILQRPDERYAGYPVHLSSSERKEDSCNPVSGMRKLKRNPIAACLRLALLCAPVLVLSACLDDLQDRQSEALVKQECSTVGQNRQVKEVMADWYLWVDYMPNVSPRGPGSPREMLNALRAAPSDGPPDEDRFSSITDREADDQFRSEGRRLAFGFTNLRTDDDRYFLTQVFPDTPAGDAGMGRGDELLRINGENVQGVSPNTFNQALGPAEPDLEVEFQAERPDGEVYEVIIEREFITIDPVGLLDAFDVGEEENERRVGYLLFRNFIGPAADQLDEAFAELNEESVETLILDLRYNGGGQLAIARQLAGQIAGPEFEGERFLGLRHNDLLAENLDTDLDFGDESGALSIDHLVVIGTQATASASEMLVNGLEPFIDVDLVGADTFGKPVGSYGFDICDQRLFPVSFETVNAEEEGGFFDGLPPDCPAADQLDRALGDRDEASLAEAIHLIETGECDTTEEMVGPWQRPGPGTPARPDVEELLTGGLR